MKKNNDKGFTGVDIAISVVIIFLFVSVIAVLIYNFNSISKEIDLKSTASFLAINEIESMKSLTFEEIKDISEANKNSEYIATQEINEYDGFFKKVNIVDYNDLDPTKIPGIIKKITVQIMYTFKGEEQKVELSTIMSKEN